MKQFVILVITLLMLGKAAVCQKVLTFESAVENWQKGSCIFPDKSLYKSADPSAVPKLEQCHNLELAAKNDSEDNKFGTELCQLFYMLSNSTCTETYQTFVQNCLNPEILEKNNPFARKDVCSYVFESPNYANYFSFMQNRDLCSRNCGPSMNSMKYVCELYALIIYQFEHKETCNPPANQSQKEEKPTEKSNQEKSNVPVTAEPVAPPRSTSDQKEDTSTTQLADTKSVNATPGALKSPEIVSNSGSPTAASNNIKSTSIQPDTSAPLKSDLKASVSGQDDSIPVGSKEELKTSVGSKEELNTSVASTQDLQKSLTNKEESKAPVSSTVESKVPVPSTNEPKLPVPSMVELKTPVPSSMESKLPVPSNGELKAPVPSKEEWKPSVSNTEERKTSESLLINKITSAASQVTEQTTILQKENTASTSKQNTESEEEDDNYNPGDEEAPEDGNESSKNNKGQSKDDKGVVVDNNNNDKGDVANKKSGSEGELPGVVGAGRKQQQELGKKIGNAVSSNVYDDDDAESSPGSGHFLAYFLTAVVICISGYVIYHNKQKILAFIIEGRNGGRNGRQRSKDVKYSQLKSNVEEVMPSLEQTATGKNFVY